jgi:hypothetical protein
MKTNEPERWPWHVASGRAPCTSDQAAPGSQQRRLTGLTPLPIPVYIRQHVLNSSYPRASREEVVGRVRAVTFRAVKPA